MKIKATTAIFCLIPAISLAQVPVDDDGNVIGQYESASDIMPIADDGAPRLAYAELQELVGPIALYPDELLAIVLPASAYPLQIVEAARFLEALESDPTLQPDADWDDSIIALINYPEVVTLMNEDLDWTFRLGEAVVIQQTDVVAAIEGFRDRAYAAGNLKSDDYQTVSNNDGVVSISPVAEDVIYVPYYEPSRVVYYQPQPVYYYHPRPYPVYYYPYAANHYFNTGYFWGVTTAFTIGWATNSLHTHHYSYYSHPYYGRTYWNDGWYYRHPSINVYNNTYVNINNRSNGNHYSHGDRWNGNNKRREYVRSEGYTQGVMRERPSANRVSVNGVNRTPSTNRVAINNSRNETIRFRQRDANAVPRTASREVPRNEVQFRARPEADIRRTSDRTLTTRTPSNARTVATARTETRTNPVQTTRRQEPAARQSVETIQARTNQRQTTTVTRTQPPRQTTRQAPATRQAQAPRTVSPPASRSVSPPASRSVSPPAREQPRQSSSSGSERRQSSSRSNSRRR